MLEEGILDSTRLGEIARLGARLIIQRSLEEEVGAFLDRARYQRKVEGRGSRNGYRTRRLQTAEGELEVAMPQLRDTAEHFVSKVIPNTRAILRTRPLEALIIGGYVRGLRDRDIEPGRGGRVGLGEQELGQSNLPRASRPVPRLPRPPSRRGRPARAVPRRHLPATRPSGAKEGVLVAWGYTATGERVLLDVCLGQRERLEDWLEKGRGLIRRGLRVPDLVVSDGAPGLVRAIEELWPDGDRQR